MRILCILLACLWFSMAHSQGGVLPAKSFDDAGIVDIRTVIPDIALDIRYAGTRNFVGERIEGYQAPKCYLLEPAALALGKVERALRTEALRLKIFDCYRPVRAVQHFMRWVEAPESDQTKSEFYPNLDKRALSGEYIAPVSGHSRGATVDLTLMTCDRSGRCEELDMGTPYDFFDPRANTDHPALPEPQRRNRDRLRAAMQEQGFENYAAEWWHFTLKPEPSTIAYDIPIR